MRHLGPGASQQAGSLPPRMFPRGIPSAALPTQSQVPSGLCSSRASRMLDSLSLASSGHLSPHGQPGGGARPPRFRSASPPPGSPPTPNRKEAPRPGLRHRVSCLTPCLRPPRIPLATHWELRFENVVRVVHIARSRGHLRALRRRVMSSSFPALPHSYRRLCSLVIPAGTLDPAPCSGKEHLSVLRSQNPACTGFAKDTQQPAKRGLAPILGCRAKLGGQAWFGP
jgi:hypothetical protein